MSQGGTSLATVRLIGRDDELERLTFLVTRGARAVTLVGAGGSGKTTLARQVAGSPAVTQEMEARWVELADLPDPALVAEAVLTALGDTSGAGGPLAPVLREAVGDQRLLLVLDNCEHLLAAVREVVEALLETCPAVTVLATSREAVGVPGEVRLAVHPLPLPRPGAHRPVDLQDVASVELFLTRAAAVDPDFSLTPATAGSVARICAHAQGLPLALELLAVRLGSMPVEELLAQLDAGLEDAGLEDAGTDARSGRLGSMRASTEWAYELLDEQQQLLLRRLSVLVGGWTMPLARAVCADDRLGAEELDAVHSLLVQRSLVHEVVDEPARFGLLAPVRAYAYNRLAASGESAATGQRFAAACLALVERELPHRAWTAPPDLAALSRLAVEHGNLLAAVDRAERDGAAASALTLSTRLWEYWRVRGHIGVGRLYAERLLPHLDAVDDRTGTDALLAAASYAQTAGDYDRCEQHIGAALVRCRRLGDEMGYGVALSILANVAAARGDQARAVSLYGQGLELGRQLGNRYGNALVLSNLALAHAALGEPGVARTMLEEADALLGETGDVWFRAYVLTCLGRLAREDGDLSSEHDLALRSAELLAAHGGGPELAESLEHLAGLETDFGNPGLGARLHAAAHDARERSGSPMPSGLRTVVGPRLAALRGVLGDEAFARHWAAGRAMSPEAAVVAARASARPRSGALRCEAGAAWPLTQRESEVADAVAQGQTNKEIARSLHISPGTVKTHLHHSMTKLGFSSRTELAAWAVRRRGRESGPVPQEDGSGA